MNDGMWIFYVLGLFFAIISIFVAVYPFVVKDFFKSAGPSVPPIYKND